MISNRKITISKTTEKEIKAFSKTAWHAEDIPHYGKHIEWNSKSFLFKATQDQQIIGVIEGRHESGIVYILSLIVDKVVRGKGVGKALLDKAISFGKKFGAHKLWLITGKGWEANKFYEKLGFEKIAELPDHHFHKDFLIYIKII